MSFFGLFKKKENKTISEGLERREEKRTERTAIENPFLKESIILKEVLTLNEASAYLGLHTSLVYKLTMDMEIPHYKPFGKYVFFRREELEDWLTRKDAEVKRPLF